MFGLKDKTINSIEHIRQKLRGLLKGGFFHIFFGNTLIKTIGFISSIIIVNIISKEEYAYLTYSDNLYAYIDLLSGFGMSAAVLKFCSSKMNKEEDIAYVTIAIKYGFLFQLALAMLLSILIIFVDIPFTESKYIIWASLFNPILTYLITTLQSYNRAHLQNKLYSKTAIIQTIIVFIFSFLFARLIGLYGIVVARYLAMAISLAVASKIFIKNYRNVSKIRLGNKKINAFLAMSLSLMIANMFSMIMPYNETFLINNLIKNEIVSSNYRIAMMIPSQLGFITGSIMIYYFPIIAQMTNPEMIYNKIKKIGIFVFLIIVIISTIGCILSPSIIRYVFGQKYLDTIPYTYVFWIAYALNSGVRMVPMNLLPALGIVKFNAVMSGISCIIHFIFDYIFISMFGIKGAAYSTIIVYTLSGIIYWFYFIYRCKKAIAKQKLIQNSNGS